MGKARDLHEAIKKAALIRITRVVIPLLCPLDIDLQALAYIKANSSMVNEYLWRDGDIQGMFKDRKGNRHYRQVLFDLCWLINPDKVVAKVFSDECTWEPSKEIKGLSPIDNPNPALSALATLFDENGKSQTYAFFEYLDMTQENVGVDIQRFCTPFNFTLQINGKETHISTFHEWYSALASRLRDSVKL